MISMNEIESWWRHNGIADRIQASGIYCVRDISNYLQITDDWWSSRTDKEKRKIYEDFFEEV